MTEASGLSSASKRGSAWRESLASLDLEAARREARQYQKNKGDWSPTRLPDAWWTGVKSVGMFAPHVDWDEPQTLPVPAHVETAYPDAEFQDFRRARADELQKSETFVTKHAPSTAPVVQPDLLFVPALFVDREGRRIGRGKGFYDRYLSAHPEVRAVAVVRSDYLWDAIPEGWQKPWDRPVHAVLTETECLEARPTHLRRNPS